VQVNATGGIKKSLFEMGLSSQTAYSKEGTRSRTPAPSPRHSPPPPLPLVLWDLLVFNKVKAALGGRMRILASGAAPLPAALHEFVRGCFGCPLLQGYGMTENAAAAVAQPVGYNVAGNVGGPLPCTEVKLEDVPDMGFHSTDV
jgi:long-chain acyl-CoA synthetase